MKGCCITKSTFLDEQLLTSRGSIIDNATDIKLILIQLLSIHCYCSPRFKDYNDLVSAKDRYSKLSEQLKHEKTHLVEVSFMAIKEVEICCI